LASTHTIRDLNPPPLAPASVALPVYRQPGFEPGLAPVRGNAGPDDPLYCRACGVRRPLHLPECRVVRGQFPNHN